MIQVVVSEGIDFSDSNALVIAAEKTLTQTQGHQDAELTIVLENDEELQRLNKEFLGIDAPTDVLSFPAEEFDPDSQSKYIGDVIISLPQATRQAQAAGHPLRNELQLLTVHGVLHLIGYDHADPEQKAEMWRIQAQILADIGCEIRNLPE